MYSKQRHHHHQGQQQPQQPWCSQAPLWPPPSNQIHHHLHNLPPDRYRSQGGAPAGGHVSQAPQQLYPSHRYWEQTPPSGTSLPCPRNQPPQGIHTPHPQQSPIAASGSFYPIPPPTRHQQQQQHQQRQLPPQQPPPHELWHQQGFPAAWPSPLVHETSFPSPNFATPPLQGGYHPHYDYEDGGINHFPPIPAWAPPPPPPEHKPPPGSEAAAMGSYAPGSSPPLAGVRPGWRPSSAGQRKIEGGVNAGLPANTVSDRVAETVAGRDKRRPDCKEDYACAESLSCKFPGHPRGKRRFGLPLPIWNELDVSAKRARKASWKERQGESAAAAGGRGTPSSSASKVDTRASRKRHRRKQHHQANRRTPSKPSAPPASAACMSALSLTAMSGFPTVDHLARTSVQLSNACREGARWAVKVQSIGMPRYLAQQFWRAREQGASSQTSTSEASTREGDGKGARQALRPASPSPPLPASRLVPRRMVKKMLVVHRCDVERILWPAGLEQLDFCDFDGEIERVAWPATLREVKFCGVFNRPIEGVVWPLSLRVLELSSPFDAPVEGLDLPDGVERIVFGDYFRRPIAGVKWPSRLKELEFGSMFNRPLDGVTWPDTLRELTFQGPFFNQPIVNTPLPRDLEVLRLGDGFDQPLRNVSWPSRLRVVDLGDSFEQDMEGVVWPKSLLVIAAPDMGLGVLPESCEVVALTSLEQQINDDVISMMSNFLLMDGFVFIPPF